MEPETQPKPHTSIVVLAEDDDDTRQLIAAFLRRDGYDVVEVEDGSELEFFLSAMYAQDRERPALILSDIRMPGRNGLEVVAHVREHDADVPIVLFSAYTTGSMRREAQNLGVAALLGKPFTLEELQRTVHELLPLPLDEIEVLTFTD